MSVKPQFLYNVHSTDDGAYCITKFDENLNVESTYIVSLEECDCPQYSKPTCRHRKMLPLFLQHNHVDEGWFLDWDTRLWRKPLSEPAPLSTEDKPTPPIIGGFPDWCLIEQCSTPNDCILNGCVLGHGTPPRSTVETAIAHSFESEASKSALNAPQVEPSPAPASLAPTPSLSRVEGVGATPFKKRKITL